MLPQFFPAAVHVVGVHDGGGGAGHVPQSLGHDEQVSPESHLPFPQRLWSASSLAEDVSSSGLDTHPWASTKPMTAMVPTATE
jgi:hypothetical protein